ncbi:class B sortase [Faecalicatena orotica]|uniref:class B sortase n=1 Tax=Faecalicatena orotica TaxID=1544 RepID=UPI003217C37B
MSRKKRQKKSSRKRSRVGDIVTTTILIAAICVFIFSAYQLVMMLVPYYSGGKEYDDVKKLAIIKDDTGKDGDEGNGDNFQVDFDALLKENPDTVAWLRFDEPSIISYPVVKSSDNQEYLTKTFSANDNKLGAIFMDMRNNKDFTDLNTFIYGHNLKVGGEMFSQLNEYASEDFCKAHPYFYIYTPNGKLTYKVFSAGTVKDIAANYILTYENEKEYTDYLQMCRNSSNYQVDVTLDAKSRIVSLSTCTNINDDERFLVQGVLVENE